MRWRRAIAPLAWTVAACVLLTAGWVVYKVTDPFAGQRQRAVQEQLFQQWRTAPQHTGHARAATGSRTATGSGTGTGPSAMGIPATATLPGATAGSGPTTGSATTASRARPLDRAPPTRIRPGPARPG